MLFTGISQLVTMAGPVRPRVREEMSEIGVVEDAAILVEDGLIVAVSDFGVRGLDRAFGLDNRQEVVDLGRRVVTPGFVDAHTHLCFAGNRAAEFEMRAKGATYQEIAGAGGGIWSTVASTRAASYSELLDETRRHRDWCVRCGTTTIEAKSGYGLTLHDEMRILSIYRDLNKEGGPEIVPTLLAAHALPRDMSKDEYLDLIYHSMLADAEAEGLAEFWDIFVENGYFEPEDARQLHRRKRDLKMRLGLRMHVDQLTEGGGAQLAAELGAKTADHLEQTGWAGIEALARSRVQPVLLPTSVFGLGLHKYPDARAMIDAGLAVVLASDFNPGSSPSPSIPFAMSLACTQMKMSPAEALTAGTINAAYSLNRGHDRGSIEVDKRADFVVWNVQDYREIPYWFGVDLVGQVYIKGLTTR